MNSQREYWNKLFSGFVLNEPDHDGWLEKYSEILQRPAHMPIIDLGCGSGHNSIFLKKKGYDVIACDFSEAALRRVKHFIPDCKTMEFDFLEGLPFEDKSVKIIVSDLSIHYFSVTDTYKVLNEIKRVLTEDGYLLCRVNSTNDTNYGAGQGELISKNYYNRNGKLKRFFDKDDIEMFFSDWNVEFLEECEMHRYDETKIVWEIAAGKRV